MWCYYKYTYSSYVVLLIINKIINHSFKLINNSNSSPLLIGFSVRVLPIRVLSIRVLSINYVVELELNVIKVFFSKFSAFQSYSWCIEIAG